MAIFTICHKFEPSGSYTGNFNRAINEYFAETKKNYRHCRIQHGVKRPRVFL